MKIAITGGTGFVGSHLVDELLAETDAEIRLLLRPGRETPRTSDRIEIQEGNILEPSSLEGFCSGADFLVHLAGAMYNPGAATLHRINVEGTRNVMEEVSLSTVRKVIYLSPFMGENPPETEYYQTRYKGEQLIREQVIPSAILRTDMVTGPEDHLVEPFVHILRRPAWRAPVLPLPGSGLQKKVPVHIKDAVSALQLLIVKEACRGMYRLEGPSVLSLKEMVQMIRSAMDSHRSIVPIPYPILWSGALMAEYFHPDPPINRQAVYYICTDVEDLGERTDPLDFECEYTFEDAVEETLESI